MRKDKVLTFRVPSIVFERMEKLAIKQKVSRQEFLLRSLMKEVKIKYTPEKFEVLE